MIPPDTLSLRALSDNEIRAVSYGLVTVAEAHPRGDWRSLHGTLADPATFGPRGSWRCACGKLSRGPGDPKLICDICGALADDARKLRRRRFGHIQLFHEIPHPLFGDCRVSVIPVLPIAFRGPKGISAGLNTLYAAVLRANAERDGEVGAHVARLYAHEWLDGDGVHPTGRPLSILGCLNVTAHVQRAAIFLQGLGVGLRIADDGAG